MKIERGQWYGWQMLPGYGAGPYFSPVYIQAVKTWPSRPNRLGLHFFNANYAPGVQDFAEDLRLMFVAEAYVVARLAGSPDRTAIVYALSEEWLERCVPNCLHALRRDWPDADIAQALTAAFLTSADPVR